jgi:hypothetical protein
VNDDGETDADLEAERRRLERRHVDGRALVRRGLWTLTSIPLAALGGPVALAGAVVIAGGLALTAIVVGVVRQVRASRALYALRESRQLPAARVVKR